MSLNKLRPESIELTPGSELDANGQFNDDVHGGK
jgi:hypothetical protein